MCNLLNPDSVVVGVIFYSKIPSPTGGDKSFFFGVAKSQFTRPLLICQFYTCWRLGLFVVENIKNVIK